MNELTPLLVPAAEYLSAAQKLRAQGFDQLADLTCVDWHPEADRFEIIVQLYNTKTTQWQRLKTRCSEDNPPPTLCGEWPAANWFEREVFDLFGVRFVGHPELKRIMLPDDWQGYPLRKDYPTEGYR